MESETQQQFSLLCNFIVEFTFVSLLQQHCVYLSLSKGPKKKKKGLQSLDNRWTSQSLANIIIVLPLLKKVVFKDLSMMEKKMATPSRSLAWEIPWTEKPLMGYS